MWLCTKLGFYSIVEKLPGEFHVRARSERDLKKLKAAVAGQVGEKLTRWKIHRTAPADYRFRIVVSRSSLDAIMVTLAAELDYSNFKGVIAKTEDQRDKLSTYTRFHGEMEDWQEQSELPRKPGWIPDKGPRFF
jgi:hypothetical protein